MKIKVESVAVGTYDVDSILAVINGVETQICFPKENNVSKFLGTEIELIKKDGVYTIADITKR